MTTQTAAPVQLEQSTLAAFGDYIRNAEAAMEETLRGSGFLWSDASKQRYEPIRQGKVVAEFFSGRGPVKVPQGLIHDWVGGVFISGGTIDEVLILVQDYNNHKNIYAPEVIASRVISHTGNDFQIYLRLFKKKIIAVVLDTDHEVHYRCLDRTRWVCRSYTTRISEVENAGTPKENLLPPDTGHGFLWRLYSYWRFRNATVVCVRSAERFR